MNDAWTFAGESADLGRGAGGTVTLVEQSSFCLCSRGGDVHPGGAQGLFADDTRLLSRFELTVGGAPPESLAVATTASSSATFVLRTAPGDAGSRLLVVRRRTVTGDGFDEVVELRNHSGGPVRTEVTLAVEADLADLFAVKEGRVQTTATTVDADASGLTVHHADDDSGGDGRRPGYGASTARVDVGPHGVEVDVRPGLVRWPVTLDPHASWSAQVSVRAEPAQGRPGGSTGAAARTATATRAPELSTDFGSLDEAYRQSLRDLDALRLYEQGDGPGDEALPVVAAGAPWFMTLFGRDSLLTASMAMLVDPELAVGVLQALARLQGTRTDPATEEQPGRILHEVRYGGASVYYGSVDATPLFVMLLGECLRWGVPWDRLEPLVPHADRALEWVERYGDRDGDGYVEYERLTPGGLPNQGWKDSSDAIVFADGRLAEPPIALCEVQGYVYAAYRARAALARRAGDAERARECHAKADALRERFDRDFWMEGPGCYALALDRHKRQVDAVASNMGHVLWTGLARPERAADVARRLTSPELFSGWGVRTLATSMAAYDPMSYQRGSVWPHDTAIAVAGLARYGYAEQAGIVARGLLEAADEQGGRLPELFGGLARDDVAAPVAYPTSCSPQAWASAAPLLALRAVLGIDPDVPAGRVRVAPLFVRGVDELVLEGVPLAGGLLTVRGDGTGEVTGTRTPVAVAGSRRAGERVAAP